MSVAHVCGQIGDRDGGRWRAELIVDDAQVAAALCEADHGPKKMVAAQ